LKFLFNIIIIVYKNVKHKLNQNYNRFKHEAVRDDLKRDKRILNKK
jgi:hypothetical protein